MVSPIVRTPTNEKPYAARGRHGTTAARYLSSQNSRLPPRARMWRHTPGGKNTSFARQSVLAPPHISPPAQRRGRAKKMIAIILAFTAQTAYDGNAYVIARNAIPEEDVQHLRRFHTALAAAPLQRAWRALAGQDLPVDALWLEHDEMWHFWRRSTLPAHASRILGDDVALLTDFFVSFRRSHTPHVIGKWHTDSTSFDVVDGASLTAWIPLDAVDPLATGGSLCVWNGTAAPPPACAAPGAAACQAGLTRRQHVPRFHLGDVLFFGPRTWHRSQPILPHAALRSRTALVARFVSVHARYRVSSDTTGPVQRKNTCPHGLQPGDIIADSACFPRLTPPRPRQAHARRTRRVRASAPRWAWLNLRRALQILADRVMRRKTKNK